MQPVFTMAENTSKKNERRSLSEVHESVEIPSRGPWWRRWLAITGPALMAAVGYMDPGNWATDIAGGSRYNYALIWVLLMSNLMAILLQSLAARLGIVSRRDLAQVCHEEYPPLVNIPLYILAEIAITATDLAEVLGSAIALQLLFGLPLIYGVMLTALDTLLLLLLSHVGIRKLESVVVALVGTIGVAFLIEIILGRPDWGGLISGFVPSLPDATALYISIGILGATVMPHNLYLHSSLVQTRKIGKQEKEIKDTIRWNNIDTGVSLNLAFFVNAAILVMAASVFYRNGYFQVAEIQDAHQLLEPILGAARSTILSDHDRKVVAYHEAGHALVAWLLPNADPVHKVTIIPRGRALGVTEQLPGEDQVNYSREYLFSRIAVMLGGRTAEELALGDITTGAENDLVEATRLARRMATRWGMGDLGLMAIATDDEQPFLGYELAQGHDYSEETSARIDKYIQQLLEDQHKEVKRLLTRSREKLEALVEALLREETIDKDELSNILGERVYEPEYSAAVAGN